MEVQTHRDLKAQYEEARLKGVSLCLTFSNKGLPCADVLKHKARFFPREWNEDDQLWIGKCGSGFDGGASIIHQCSEESAASLKKNDRSDKTEHSSLTVYNIDEMSDRKKVNFSASVECRTYRIGSIPTEFFETQFALHRALLQQSGETPIMESARGKQHPTPWDDANGMFTSNLAEFLQWLENDGGLANFSLNQMNKLLAQFKENCQLKRTIELCSRKSKSEMDLKYTLLKIHVNAAQAIQLSKSLKDWIRLCIAVEKIDSIDFQGINPILGPIIVGDVTFIAEGRDPEPLRQLPAKDILTNIRGQNEIVYSDTVPPYHVKYNPVMTKGHAIKIKLSLSDQTNGNLVDLGNAHCDLGELHQRCIGHGCPQEFHLRLNSNSFLKSARICLKATFETLNIPEYIEDKHKNANKIMRNVIEWTQRFQKDLATYNVNNKVNLHSLGTDLKIGCTGLSLLHAGMYMKQWLFSL